MNNYPTYQIINHFTDTDLYKLTMCCAILHCFPRAIVKYEFVDRNNTVYPKGFADEVWKQVNYLKSVKITDDEINFMKRKCYYIPYWFYTYLKGFEYNLDGLKIEQDSEGHLKIEFEGYWHEQVLLEVQLLAIISELFHYYNGDFDKMNLDLEYRKAYYKGRSLIQNGLVFSDFGTRRRFSYSVQEKVIEGFKMAQKSFIERNSGNGCFRGTSNVYLAMKYDLIPIGTMAHEWISFIAAVYGVQEANNIAMQKWSEVYKGALGIYLYDTYTWKAFEENFSEDFARQFSGLRVDSGDNIEQFHKIVDKYNSLRIDASSKEVVFSNGLNTEQAIAIHNEINGRVKDSYGIGTYFTCDIEGVKPMNIVIKLIEGKLTEKREMNPTCKLSEDYGKYCGNENTINTFKFLLKLK